MARTISQIYDALIAEKQTMLTLTGLQPAMDDQQTLLADLNSPSKVAIWRLWAYITAVAIWTHETLFDLFKADVEAIVAKFRPGSLKWYQEQAFAFQYGDPLVLINGKYQYAVIDATKQIVARCSVSEPSGNVRIKVAKLVSGVLAELTSGELIALSAYFTKIKYPGTLVVVSYAADKMKIYMTVYYDALMDLATVTASVEAAVNGYIGELPFDGVFNLTALTDKVQKVTGVVDPRIDNVEATYGSVPYATVTREYSTNSGYAVVDPLFPLSTTITYVPHV